MHTFGRPSDNVIVTLMLVSQGADQADPQSVSVTIYCYFAGLEKQAAL
jgi:hypothetical protein